jgi:UDP-GlcNAc3NAcA epimerase
MKILTIVGARPQFIKAASVSREFEKYNEIQEVIVHTGQHYDTSMSEVFFTELKIPPPKYQLNFGGLSHGSMTGLMIQKIEEVAIIENPNWVLVYGDTNSTLAGAIVASKLGIKLAHVEAGLRSFNMNMPEEINRIIADRVSNLLLCPSKAALQNLHIEGFSKFDCKFVNVGDVMLDGVNFYKKFSKKPKVEVDDHFILCTLHRAGNTDNKEKLKNILEALNEISIKSQVVLPLHPRTFKIIQNLKLNVDNLTLIEPIGYLEMIWMIDNCSLVMTDSGGLQKEAYFFDKRCVTLRDDTEWTELVENGVNTLVGSNKIKILQACRDNINLNFGSIPLDIYGKGDASNKVVNELINF